ncbi:phospholipase D-like domain-containing protein [Flavihumibacter fluvii]|uniref:phospholipase D-like domain-containing protein n=1 Tax=Flavihumibacter fluvii TaxID=2838157 RepID=UPI001BDEC389|nr:phospholipase D-like domain-containing protein [Flavihumibacter fluvii]ULQ51703.1 phospholipase D-like domain-containing protein [Flavihumibacter fluvii]
MTTASFNDIRKKIQNNIDQSKVTILIAVAWLTSKDLLGQLTDKLESGCKVEIIISDHFENQRLSYNKFIDKGGKVYILPTVSGRFLHDKFALFDNTKLIAGSYNWTNSAEFYNHEFIIQSENAQLLKQFKIRFDNLKKIVATYDKQKLLSRDNLTAETKEEEFLKIEDELHVELIASVDLAVKAGAKIVQQNILNQIYNYGAIGAASRLIKEGTEKLHSGLIKLFEIDRLDLTIESIILKDRYRVLFHKDILEKAQQRLDKLK